MPLTNAEVFVIIYFGSMDLSASAIQEILRLKIYPLSSVAQRNIGCRVTEICLKEQKERHLALKHSSGEWKRSTVDDFLRKTARGLSDDEQRSLTQIGDDEQEIIDRDEITRGSKRHRARERDTSRNGPGHRQSSRASASPPAHTTGFAPINQYQPHEMTHATVTHSPREPRHESSPPGSHHYQTSDSSTATNFQSPYGPNGNNYGRPIDNQPAYNSAMYGGGRASASAPLQSLDYPYPASTTHSSYHAGAPLQSLDYPYPAPTTHSNYHAGAPLQSLNYPYAAATPHSEYHAGRSDGGGERRSTRPTETSGYTSTIPRPKGPLGPDGRDDVYL